MAGELTEQVVVRVPDDIHRALKDAAERDERTVSQQVRFIIRQHLAENGADHD